MKNLACLVALSLLISLVSCSRAPQSTPPATKSADGKRISPSDGNAAEPAITVAKNGELYLVYAEHHGDKNADIFLQPLDADGNITRERTRVNNEPDNATAWRGDPPTIDTNEDGTIFVGWNRKYADAKGNDLVLSVSSDGGRSFLAPVKVNDDEKPASHGMHSLTVEETGQVIMVWLDERNINTEPHKMETMGAMMHHDETEPNSEVFTAISVDGGKTFSKNVQLATDVCPCCKTSVVASSYDGSVYASWRQVLKGDHRHIAVAASKDMGANFGPGVIVSDDNWQISACPVSGASLRSPGSNEVEVYWYTAGSTGPPGVYTAHSINGGKTFSERRLVSSDARGGTPVCDGESCIFTAGDGDVLIQALNAEKPMQIDIPDASVPAAIFGPKPLVAFVRLIGDSPSVWIKKINN